MEDTTSAGTTVQEQQAILINKNEKIKKLKVMVAIDDSDGSFYALKWAVDHLFVATGVAPETSLEEVGMVVLVHVQQPFQHLTVSAGPGGAGNSQLILYTLSLLNFREFFLLKIILILGLCLSYVFFDSLTIKL